MSSSGESSNTSPHGERRGGGGSGGGSGGAPSAAFALPPTLSTLPSASLSTLVAQQMEAINRLLAEEDAANGFMAEEEQLQLQLQQQQ